MTTIFSQTVTLDLGALGEVEVVVDYTYSAGRPGKMYLRNGDPGYPEEPAEVEIMNVWFHELCILKYLTDKALDALYDTIINNHDYEE